MIVATLLGEKHVELALTCLGSMHAASRDELVFRIHEDGTLTPASAARLAAALPVESIVRKASADAIVQEALTEFPACRRFRDQFVYGIKLFDLAILHPTDDVAFVDCDVLFLQPFSGLFAIDPQTEFVFMQDSQHSYSLRPWHLLGPRRVRVPRRLNGGMFFFRKHAYDLPLLEDVIGRDYPVYHKSFWLEQTCFGALAMASQSLFWSSRQVIVPSRADDLTDNVIAAHLTSSVRGLLPAALECRRLDSAPVAVEKEAVRQLGAAEFAAAEICRAVARRLS